MANEIRQLSESLHPQKPTRQACLKAWMIKNGIEARAMADVAGVSPQMMSMIICGSRAPRERIERLVAAGVPRDLLPEPSCGKRGPKTASAASSPSSQHTPAAVQGSSVSLPSSAC